ncbi:MAG: undecaprenyl-diphosphate phosphatase [Ruminococcaceae bacterium]|nr:undecaprenyl-diphosphate phosphatase [Oscillospiraceae bacterium]
MIIELLKAVFFGIVEGITEWLPVSSTGHLILLDELLRLEVAPELGAVFAEEYMSMFEVVIQLGAIMAVVVIFFGKLNPFALSKSKAERRDTWTLWFKIAVASIPAALIGIVGDKLLEKATGRDIDGWIYNWAVVATALIFYGVLFIVVEKWQDKRAVRVDRAEDISYRDALLMGGFQALSIVPGTSRSGSTILGARTMGISRSAAAEFSFFMGIPAMAGGSLIKALGFFDYVAESGVSVPALAWIVLIVASASAFAVSLFVIRFLMDFVKKHSFALFGVYRIILGVAVIAYFLIR